VPGAPGSRRSPRVRAPRGMPSGSSDSRSRTMIGRPETGRSDEGLDSTKVGPARCAHFVAFPARLRRTLDRPGDMTAATKMTGTRPGSGRE
jgi:hypothetical protein